jgi:Zn-dependent protease
MLGESLIAILFSVPIILFSLSLHEWAHGYVAYRLGDPTARSLGRLTLNPLKHFDIVGGLCMLLFRFGWAKPVPINSRYFKKPRRDMTLVSLAGPVSNLVLSFLGYFVYCVIGHNAPQNAVFGMMLNFFAIFTVMNLSLAVFNLLPIPPLDGSRLLYLVLPPKWSFKLAEWERYSFWILMLFLFLGGRFGFLTWVINGFLWLFDLAIGWLPFL